MADSERTQPVPLALEALIKGLAELPAVLGPAVRPAVAAVEADLREAMAARDRGDIASSLRRIEQAMARIVELADRVDPMEAHLMRAVAHQVGQALAIGDTATARQQADTMLARSGGIPTDAKRS